MTILSLAMPLLFSAQLQWNDAVVGRHFVSSGPSARSSTIHSFAQLVAILDHTLLQGQEDGFQPSDTAIAAIEKTPCKLALVDSSNGYTTQLVEWGKPDSGLVFVVDVKADSLFPVDFFRYRPTAFFRGKSGIRFEWSHSGKPCEQWKYGADLVDGRYRFPETGLVMPSAGKCKDPLPRLVAKRRIETEIQRDSNLRCDVFDFFPKIGGCWSLDESEEPKLTDDPENPADY